MFLLDPVTYLYKNFDSMFKLHLDSNVQGILVVGALPEIVFLRLRKWLLLTDGFEEDAD